MHPSGSSTLVDGEQFVSPALIQLKFSILESQGSLLPPQTAFTSVEIECYRFFFFPLIWLWTKKYKLVLI